MMNPAEFENIAQAEDSFWWYRGMHEITLRLLQRMLPAPPERMLEAGCGTGAFARELTKQFRCVIDLADLAEEGLARARGKGLRRLLRADVRALPLAAEQYDCVLSLDVLVHLERGMERAAFAEMARVLRPGGMVIIRVAALDVLRSRHSVFIHERRRFTKAELIRIATEHGLSPIRCTYLNCLLAPVALFRFRIWEPLLGKSAESGVKPISGWLNTALRCVLRLEAYWVCRGGNLPLGQTLLLFARKQGPDRRASA